MQQNTNTSNMKGSTTDDHHVGSSSGSSILGEIHQVGATLEKSIVVNNSVIPQQNPIEQGDTIVPSGEPANANDTNQKVERVLSSFLENCDIVLPSDKIVFIGGGGSIGSCIIRGVVTEKSELALRIFASSPRLSSLQHLPIPKKNMFTDNLQAATLCDTIFLCVRPLIANQVIQSLSLIPMEKREKKLIVSLVHGLKTSEIETLLPGIPVIRAVPNVAAVVRHSATAVCFSSSVNMQHVSRAGKVLEAVGTTQYIPENRFAAGAAISGAYTTLICSLMDIVVNIAIVYGIPRASAVRLAAECLVGTAKLLVLKQSDPGILRTKLESPGDIALVGSIELEKSGFHGALHSAIEKMIEKAQQNGES